MMIREKELRQRGIRLTPQRRMILDAIDQSNGHLTAEEIYEHIIHAYPDLSISTVYRNLERLLYLHLITVTDLGKGRACYQVIEGRRHHHLICHKCGAMIELDDEALNDLRRTIQTRYGFVASIDHLALWGLCRSCQQDSRHEQS